MEKVVIVIIGVVLGAALTVARELFNDYRSKIKKERLISVRVVFVLEKFISECVDVVQDDGDRYGRDNDGCLRLHAKKTEIDFLSLDLDWSVLPFEVMYEILNFPSLVSDASDTVSSVWEFVACPPDYEEGIEERHYQYARLGIIANKISNNLRAKYGMPEREYKNWNSINFLRDKKGAIDELRKVRESDHIKMMERLDSSAEQV